MRGSIHELILGIQGFVSMLPECSLLLQTAGNGGTFAPLHDNQNVKGSVVGSQASLAGFEPATRCLEGSRSVQLSYRDAVA